MNLALFDFDGTITVNDTWTAFLRFAVRPRKIAVGSVLFSPQALGYRLGMVSASTARPMVARFAFRGELAASVRELGEEYASQVLPRVVRRRALDRIEWHQREGDVVVVVSGSLDAYLRPWCKALDVQLICTELEERDGTLTGKYLHEDCSGTAKVRRILAQYELSRFSLIYAYGDTSEDREMLDIAHRKYYRWKQITDSRETTAHGHPGVERPARRSRRAG